MLVPRASVAEPAFSGEFSIYPLFVCYLWNLFWVSATREATVMLLPSQKCDLDQEKVVTRAQQALVRRRADCGAGPWRV